MDVHVKEGQLYVQHQKFGKKWKKNWFVLYPASQNGIARLEFFDSSGGGAGGGGGSGSVSSEKTRKLDKKIIRLSECISILPALTEACPKENMAAFCVETNDKTHMFAAEQNTAKEWMETMCDIAFQPQGGSGSGNINIANSNGGPQELQMSENLIYYSREEANEFWVSVQRTEASERCGLSGSYWLKAENDVLILKDSKIKKNILVWPYKLLRRYGRDRVMFSFEAGRRCDSGPGSFTFETKQGNEIFALVDQAIQSQKALAEDPHPSRPNSFEPDCPASLLHIHNAAPSAASGDSGGREADGDSGGSKPGSADGVLGKRDGGDGGVGRGPVGGLKGRCLPELPAMLGVGSRGQAAAKAPPAAEGTAGLYSEPADSVRLPNFDNLYSDPVDSIAAQGKVATPPTPMPRLRPVGDEASGDHHHAGGNHRKPPDLYSHMYDHISVELKQKTAALSLNGGGRRGGKVANRKTPPPGGQGQGPLSSSASSSEHIYDEPEGCAQGGAGSTSPLGMTIYDEAWVDSKKQDDAAPPSGVDRNYSTLSLEKMSESCKQCTPQPGPSRPLRWTKPATAPKPAKGGFARKEPMPLPYGKTGGPGSNTNNNNNIWSVGGRKEIYSKVSKQKTSSSPPWLEQQKQTPMRAPDIIYDNLGNI
ncbi:docking protein 1b isoform X2 [Takifugu flavidus]|uniref:docking protein 1b isoform X2 n=1 Tax=Takifugu flavidus TaxID=433684 RepID=UPI0025447CD7|nr:docking protein 1b isoform X2 [Takifugu flavidus]